MEVKYLLYRSSIHYGGQVFIIEVKYYYKLNRNSCIKNLIKATLQRETQYNKPDGID